MLIIQRRVGQRIVMSGGVEIVLTSIDRGGVRIGVIAPRGVSILRGEVYDAIVAANADASASDPHATHEHHATPAEPQAQATTAAPAAPVALAAGASRTSTGR
jgi:carbon storage regulator